MKISNRGVSRGMRRLVVTENITVDGVIDATGGWFDPTDATVDQSDLIEQTQRHSAAADDAAIGRLLHPDVRVGHLPHAGGLVGDQPAAYARRDQVVAAWAPLLHADPPIGVRLLATSANRQPAVATYIRAAGATDYSAFAVNVLRIDQDLITEVVTFPGTAVDAFGLPGRLSDEDLEPGRQ